MTEPDTPSSAVPLLIPDLPTANQLEPWLQRIDRARWYTNFGALVREFEASLANSLGTPLGEPAVVTLNTGTAPLELAIAALDLPVGSSVIIPSFTFPATATAVLRNGLRPRLVDVAPDTWLLTPQIAVEALRDHRSSLVIPVACFGCPPDVGAWDHFVDATGVQVLVDAAAAFGNLRPGRNTHLSFSFHATKPLGIGEGGALATHDRGLADRVRRLSNFGFEGDTVRVAGTNAKMSEYAAAVGLAQLGRWPEIQSRRTVAYRGYTAALLEIPRIELQSGYAESGLPAMLAIRTPARAALLADRLREAGIHTRRWYCPPLHMHPLFEPYRDDSDLGVCNDLARHALGLPWFPSIEHGQYRRVVDALSATLSMDGEISETVADV